MKKEERGKGCSGPDQQSRNWFLASKAMRKRGTDVGSSVWEPSVWGGTHTEIHRYEQRNKKRQRERERERWGGAEPGGPASPPNLSKVLWLIGCYCTGWGREPLGRMRMWESKACSLGRQRKPKSPKQAAAGNP